MEEAFEIAPDSNIVVDVHLSNEDLKIDTYRSGGLGGQHANTTNSAVRITHIPNGMTIAIQDERSQHMEDHLDAKLQKYADMVTSDNVEEELRNIVDRVTLDNMEEEL